MQLQLLWFVTFSLLCYRLSSCVCWVLIVLSLYLKFSVTYAFVLFAQLVWMVLQVIYAYFLLILHEKEGGRGCWEARSAGSFWVGSFYSSCKLLVTWDCFCLIICRCILYGRELIPDRSSMMPKGMNSSISEKYVGKFKKYSYV